MRDGFVSLAHGLFERGHHAVHLLLVITYGSPRVQMPPRPRAPSLAAHSCGLPRTQPLSPFHPRAPRPRASLADGEEQQPKKWQKDLIQAGLMARFKGSAPKNAKTLYLSKDPRELCKELCRGAGTPTHFPATLGAATHTRPPPAACSPWTLSLAADAPILHAQAA